MQELQWGIGSRRKREEKPQVIYVKVLELNHIYVRCSTPKMCVWKSNKRDKDGSTIEA
jgi:hypothetical protein